MGKKIVFCLLSLIVVSTVIFTACTAAPTTKPTTAPTSTPTAAPPQTFQFTFNDHNPPGMPVNDATVAYVKYIEEKSGGRIKINLVSGGALFSADEAWRQTQTGGCDAAVCALSKEYGVYLNDVVSLPFLGWPGRDETTKIYHALLDKFPEMRKEFGNVTYRTFGMMPPVQMHWRSKVVKTPADVKGVKSFCAEAIYADTYSALGGVPVNIDITEMYQAVEKGVVEGVVNHAPVCFVFGALELLKSHTYFGQGGISMAPVGMIWNNNSYNKLPDDLKKVVNEADELWYKTFMEKEVGFNAMVEGKIKEWGHTMVVLTPSEIAQWRDMVKDAVINKWIKAANDKGLPGTAVYEEALKLAASYQK